MNVDFRYLLWARIRDQTDAGAFLPWWAILARTIIFPLDTIYWILSKERGYQLESDTWIIDGIHYKAKRKDGLRYLEQIRY